jgi:hydrogenase maturation protease
MREVLLLAIGNRLGTDDGVGARVLEGWPTTPGVRCVDGGTCGLTLLPRVEEAEAVAFVDAAHLGDAPGTVRVHEGSDLDAIVTRTHGRSVHEVGLAQLVGAAAFRGTLPARRALVSVEPAHTGLGLELSPVVAAALPRARAAVAELLGRWASEARGAA